MDERDDDNSDDDGGLDSEGDQEGGAVAGVEDGGGFDERFFKHGGTSSKLKELLWCASRRGMRLVYVCWLDTGGGGSVPMGVLWWRGSRVSVDDERECLP
jgi:hypothetical protein